MSDKLDTALDRCLARMLAGENIEACLKGNPELGPDLLPLLMSAADVSGAEKIDPETGFADASRTRVLLRISDLPQEATAPTERLWRELCNILQRVISRFPSPVVPSSRVLIPLGATAMVVLMLTTFLVPPGAASVAADCSITTATGQVQVLPSATGDWTSVEAGMTLKEGARIRTAADSEAVVTLFDGSTVEILPNSELEFQHMQSIGEDQKTIQLAQIAGQTWHRVMALVDSRSSYEVRTPSAYCAVRGTYFEVNMQEDNVTLVRVHEGTVAVIACGEEVDVCAGFRTEVREGAIPDAPTVCGPNENEEQDKETCGGDSCLPLPLAVVESDDTTDKDVKDELKDAKEDEKDEEKDAKEDEKDAKEDEKDKEKD